MTQSQLISKTTVLKSTSKAVIHFLDILNFIFEAYMTNERKEFIDKYIKEIIATSYGHCSLCNLLDNGCKNCQLTDSVYCFNPWYVRIFTLQTEEDRKNENYNNTINEVLTYISSTYPETFV